MLGDLLARVNMHYESYIDIELHLPFVGQLVQGTEVLLESFPVIWGVHRAVGKAVISNKANLAVYTVGNVIDEEEKQNWASTDPFRTPDSTSAGSDAWSSIRTLWIWPDKKACTHLLYFPLMQ